MIASAGKRSLLDRMLGAALLEAETYQEAAITPALRNQAALVVIVSSLAAGLGGLGAGLAAVVLGTLAGLAGWAAYAFVAYRVATVRFGVPRDATVRGSTLRVLAMASAPRLFLILAVVPGIGLLVGLAAHAWVLITTVFALRTALDLEARPAIIVAAGACLPMLLLWVMAATLL